MRIYSKLYNHLCLYNEVKYFSFPCVARMALTFSFKMGVPVKSSSWMQNFYLLLSVPLLSGILDFITGKIPIHHKTTKIVGLMYALVKCFA